MKRLSYEATVRSCFVAYIVQAIIVNFAPLLFVTFQRDFGISLSEVTLLITFNFLIQILVDLASAYFVDRIGYRAAMITAHLLSAAGLLLLSELPFMINNAYIALLISVAIYAIGGGLLEVVVSPVVEACPTKNKEKEMSMLHSFYCWGFVTVIIISTLFFHIFGIEEWRVMAKLWMLVPLVNMIAFFFVPIYDIVHEEKKMGKTKMFRSGIFWLLFFMMIASGASEQAVGQWASAFAETGLNISKTIGDLAGPCLFAFMQGLARFGYGRIGDRVNIHNAMMLSLILCVLSYLLISISPFPVLSLAGCALCGFSVGILWPGTLSVAAAVLPKGGTAMFALLAMAGDLGGSIGPGIVGRVTQSAGNNIQVGMGGAMRKKAWGRLPFSQDFANLLKKVSCWR